METTVRNVTDMCFVTDSMSKLSFSSNVSLNFFVDFSFLRNNWGRNHLLHKSLYEIYSAYMYCLQVIQNDRGKRHVARDTSLSCHGIFYLQTLHVGSVHLARKTSTCIVSEGLEPEKKIICSVEKLLKNEEKNPYK